MLIYSHHSRPFIDIKRVLGLGICHQQEIGTRMVQTRLIVKDT